MVLQGQFLMSISGPQASVEAMLSRLNEEGIDAERIDNPHQGNTEDEALGWISVVTRTEHFPVPVEFQQELLSKVGSLSEELGFRVRTHGVPAQPVQQRYMDHRITRALVGGQAKIVFNAPDPDLVWDQLRKTARVPGASMKLRAAEATSGISLQGEFSAYIQQAETYYRAGGRTDGASAALQYYYSILNLAKAEILLWQPESLVGKRVTHGVSARISDDSPDRWHITVQPNGVFPLLYIKRMNTPSDNLPNRIDAIDLFARCVEAGLEYSQWQESEPKAVSIFHSVVSDGMYSWGQILTEGADQLRNSEATWKLLMSAFEDLSPFSHPDPWRVFGVSTRLPIENAILLSPKRGKYVRVGNGLVRRDLHLSEWADDLKEVLRPVLGSPQDDGDGTISISLDNHRMIGLPVDLARYLGLYLLSNLVRYKPSALSPNLAQSWYFDSFTRQATLPALQSFANHILDSEFVFLGGRRT